MANSINIDVSANTASIERSFASVNKAIKQLSQATADLNTTFKALEQNKSLDKNVERSSKAMTAFREEQKRTAQQIKEVSQSLTLMGLAAAGLIQPFATGLVGSVAQYGATAKAAAGATKIFSEKMFGAMTGAKKFGETTRQLGATVGHHSKTFFGFTEALAIAGLGLAAIGRTMEKSDTQLQRMAGTALLVAGIFTGGLAFAITKAITLVGDLTVNVGDYLVSVFVDATEKFIKFNQTAVVFSNTLASFNRLTDGAVGSTESWEKAVVKTSDSFNFSRDAVRKAGQEIVSVTSQMGFNEDQMQKLLTISGEYAAFNKKDMFQTTVNMVSALNGNAQAVQALGIKLGQASLQQFLFDKGVNKSFESLTSSEKIQIRYNKLLKSYGVIAGAGAVAADTMAGQQERFKINVENLTRSLGAGASIIENNNVLYAIFNKGLSLVSENVVGVIGFLGALSGRLLQVTGFFLKWAFAVTAVKTAIDLLNIGLSGDLTQSIINMPIKAMINKLIQFVPILGFLTPGVDLLAKKFNVLNLSIVGLTKASGASFVSFATVGTTLRTVVSSLAAQLKILASSILGVNVATLSFSTILSGVFARAVMVARLALVGLGKVAALVFSPIVIAVAAAVGAFFVLKKALEIIEERTRVFSTAWGVIVRMFSDSASVFSGPIKFFKDLGDAIVKVASQALGLLVTGLAKVISGFASLANIGVFKKVFGEENLSKINAAKDRLNNLSAELKAVDYDFRQLEQTASRSIDSINSKKFDIEKFVKIRDELNKLTTVGQLSELKKMLDERNKVVGQAINEGAIKESEGRRLILAAERDYQKQRTQILMQAAAEDAARREAERQAQTNAAFSGSENKIAFLLQDFENLKTVQDQINEQQSARQQIIGDAAFQQLAANLGREKALKEVMAAQDLARAGKTADAIKKIQELKIESEKNGLASLFSFEKNTNAGRAANFKSTLGTIASLSQENNSTLFAIGKAAGAANATIDGIAAVQKALASAPPPFNFALAAIVGTATALNVSKILSSKPPQKFQSGGFVGGASAAGDRVPAYLNSGEFVANQSQQRNIIQNLANNSVGGGGKSSDIKELRDAIMSQPIIINIDNKEVARAVRNAQEDGFKLKGA